MSEKTEDATPQKLRESRKKGQVSQSQDIPKLLISIGILETLFAMVDTGMQRLQECQSSDNLLLAAIGSS